MTPSNYRDMHLLDEVAQTPDLTQRELSKRIGAALGLTNLMVRRLVKKGYIKISGTKRSRLRYLITPQGILEKSRLTYAFIQYSLQLYGRVRVTLREQLAGLAQAGHRRILLCGTGELAEIAFLTIREMGLDLVGVVDETPARERFLNYPIQGVREMALADYDRLIVMSLQGGEDVSERLVALGVPPERILTLQSPFLRGPSAGASRSSLDEAITVAVESAQPSPTATGGQGT